MIILQEKRMINMLVLKYIIITGVGWCHVKNIFCGQNWIIWRPPDNISKTELLREHNSKEVSDSQYFSIHFVFNLQKD